MHLTVTVENVRKSYFYFKVLIFPYLRDAKYAILKWSQLMMQGSTLWNLRDNLCTRRQRVSLKYDLY